MKPLLSPGQVISRTAIRCIVVDLLTTGLQLYKPANFGTTVIIVLLWCWALAHVFHPIHRGVHSLAKHLADFRHSRHSVTPAPVEPSAAERINARYWGMN